MKKDKKLLDTKMVKAVNKNVRSSTRKLNPILKNIVGKKVDLAITTELQKFYFELKKIVNPYYYLLIPKLLMVIDKRYLHEKNKKN